VQSVVASVAVYVRADREGQALKHSILDLCSALPKRKLVAGETMIVHGHCDNRLYVLAEGMLEVLKHGVRINTYSEPGAIFGELSVLLGVPHTASVAALEPSTVLVVDEADSFLRAHPEITYFVTRMLAQRLKYVSDYLVDIKRQYEAEAGHLSMVDDVLATLVHSQDESAKPGSERYPDTGL
jgi:cAMP-binding proteins - catabolite gene activator and regulatory subunit of cAMP-dependent protein kinases